MSDFKYKESEASVPSYTGDKITEGQSNGTLYTQETTVPRLHFGANDYFDKDALNYNFQEITKYFETFQTELINTIYPVGSIIITATSTNPQTRLGGTWNQIGQGRCLFGVGPVPNTTNISIAANETGGSAAAPLHSHSVNAVGDDHSLNITTELHHNGAHSHIPAAPGGISSPHFACVNSKTAAKLRVAYAKDGGYWTIAVPDNSKEHIWTQSTNSNGRHTHTASSIIEGNTNSSGGANKLDASIANLPPYLGVYFWKKISNVSSQNT